MRRSGEFPPFGVPLGETPWGEKNRGAPALARSQVSIRRGAKKSATIRACESIGCVHLRYLLRGPKIALEYTPWGPTKPRGALRIGEMEELRISPGILGFLDHPFVSLSSPPIRGGFVYFEFPPWVLGVNGHPQGPPPGTPRNAKER